MLFAAAALPILIASAAYACQSTVTLYASPSTVAQGGTVNVTGNKYNNTFRPVEIHLDSRTGPVLATATPSGGTINAQVTIPASTSVGYHVLIATQYNSAGTPCTGCPGRATIKVVSATTAASADNGSGFGGAALMTNPFGLAGFGLASLALAVRRHRRRATAVA